MGLLSYPIRRAVREGGSMPHTADMTSANIRVPYVKTEMDMTIQGGRGVRPLFLTEGNPHGFGGVRPVFV